MMERKRRQIPLSALMEFDSLAESSEDSDFRIEDHSDESNEDEALTEEDSTESEDKPSNCNKISLVNAAEESPKNKYITKQESILSCISICCVCLGDKSNDEDEIVECDSCGITVHEDCYGIPDNESVSTNESTSSKVSWFCEACLADVENPTCELCPNVGGIFKETDTGKWVHLVCALYIPGVAFREVDKLSNVTLFEMPYSKWGERICSLCPDQQFAQTGVCIRCDAGLCRTYFHVTCAQKEGLLSEAQTEEMNHADPFYAHCKLHSDKDVSKIKKRNWLAFELQIADYKKQHTVEGCSDSQKAILTKENLKKFQHKYSEYKVHRESPWIPTQKMSRPLISSASTLRALSQKAVLSGIDTQALVMKEAHSNALADVHRKWHIPPAFNVEYMGYYLDRNCRISSLRQNLDVLVEENSKMVKEQKELQVLYNEAMENYEAEVASSEELKKKMKFFEEILPKCNLSPKITKWYDAICIASGNSPSRSSLDNLNATSDTKYVSGSCQNREFDDLPKSLCLPCVICKKTLDQHLLIRCDICHMYYHIGCLDPPLTRLPKKTKVMGWQCSECDKTSSDSDMEIVDIDTPRQLRQVKGSWTDFKTSFKTLSLSAVKRKKRTPKKVINSLKFGCKAKNISVVKQIETSCNKMLNRSKGGKSRQKETSASENSADQSTKKQCLPLKTSNCGIEESVAVEKPCDSHPSQEYLVKEPNCVPISTNNGQPKKQHMSGTEIMCDICKKPSEKSYTVTCDECMKGFHFFCLNPPVKKSPKVRGYSWHCADCDPSESESD